jgi:hypothetical protein
MSEVQYIVTLPQANQTSAIQLPSKTSSFDVVSYSRVKRIDGQVIQLSPTIQSPLMTLGVSIDSIRLE